MPAYLSDDWVAALDAAARSHPGLAAAAAGVHLVLEQVVTINDGAAPPSSASHSSGEVPGPREVRWHVVIDDGSVRFVWGPAPQPTVRFTTDAPTASAITSGGMSATEAFMAGRLRVGGDTTVLVAHHALLAGIGDVFAAVVTE